MADRDNDTEVGTEAPNDQPSGSSAGPGDPRSSGRRSAGAPSEGESPAPSGGDRPEGKGSGGAGEPAEREERAVEEDLDRLLDETKRERDEYLELARRTKADFENYRRRVASEAAAAERKGKAGLAAGLVPVLDSLEGALAAAGIEPRSAAAGDARAEGALEQGVVLTYRALHETLARAGVEPIDPAGEPFDPNWHEALQTRAAEGAKSGTVVEVLQRGYRLDGQVIRAARVVVSQ